MCTPESPFRPCGTARSASRWRSTAKYPMPAHARRSGGWESGSDDDDCCTSVLYGPGKTTISRSRYGADLGGARGTRTPDPLLAKQVLFQLSYSPEFRRSKGTCGRGALVDAADGARLGDAPADAPDADPARASPAATVSPPTDPAGPDVLLPSSRPGSWAIPSIRCVAPAARSRSSVCPPVSTPATTPAPDRLPHWISLAVLAANAASRTSSTPSRSIAVSIRSGQGQPRGASSGQRVRSISRHHRRLSSTRPSRRRDRLVIRHTRRPDSESWHIASS